MPVIVSYQPVGALGDAAEKAFAARSRSVRTVIAPEINAEAPTQEQLEYGNSDPRRSLGSGGGGGDRGATSPSQSYTSPEGQTYQVSPQQRTTLRNLEASGSSGNAFQEGLQKVLGLPEAPVAYTVPQDSAGGEQPGTVLQLSPNDYALRTAADRRMKQAKDIATARLKQAQEEATAREKAAQATNQYRYDALDQHSADLKTRLDAAEKRAGIRTQAGQTLASARTELQLHDNNISMAKAQVSGLTGDLGRALNDPDYKDPSSAKAAQAQATVKALQMALGDARARLDSAYKGKEEAVARHTVTLASTEAQAQPQDAATQPRQATSVSGKPIEMGADGQWHYVK